MDRVKPDEAREEEVVAHVKVRLHTSADEYDVYVNGSEQSFVESLHIDGVEITHESDIENFLDLLPEKTKRAMFRRFEP